MITRTLDADIANLVTRGKAILLIGPRQVGKTTLIRQQLADTDYKFFDGDEPLIRSVLAEPNTAQIRQLIGDAKVIFIDEAQRIDGIGLTLKIMIDQFKGVQLWVSGSSSFTLAQALNDSLAGRKWEYELFPISWEEYQNHVGYLEAERNVEHRLLYGFYPEVINHPGEEQLILNSLIDSALYRDILAYAEIRKPQVLEDLVRALALQISSEVNYNELANLLRIDRATVERYIDILEKGYVVFRLRSYSRNLRSEIKRSRKIYFYDIGIRNAVISNFDPLDFRSDKGALWENFLITERLKQNRYKRTWTRPYFWRTAQQQEVDYVEEINQRLTGYEFKWSDKRRPKFPKPFVEKYAADTHVIHRQNFREFVIIGDG